MVSIFSDFFNNWVNAFEQEEGKKKPAHLPNAKENYRETAKYQMVDYIKKVDAAKKRGKEYCNLVSSEPYPMRQEHIDYFLMSARFSTIRPRSFQTSFLAPPIFLQNH